MVDLLTKAQRSKNMGKIRSKHTKPELIVRSLLHSMGYRFRIHKPELPGKPDIVFPSRLKIVDVRGCFWHSHGGCIDSHLPKSRSNYWGPKLQRNKQRDQRNLNLLNKLGWKVLIVWECNVVRSKPSKLKEQLREFLGRR